LSLQVGRGVEHQLPHLYSQVGVGVTVYVEVQREAVVLVVEVVGGGGLLVVVQLVVGGGGEGVDELLGVLEVCNLEISIFGKKFREKGDTHCGG